MKHSLAATLRPTEPPAWRHALREVVRDPAELIELLGLDPVLLPAARRAVRLFPLRVPRGFVARMQPGDPNDPLLRQVLPLGAEMAEADGFGDDPVGDGNALRDGGVLHKYHGRALLVATGACAINCRYCFRRHFPYGEANAAAHDWRGALDYLRADPSIREVILSGGDPLVLPDERLTPLADALAAVPHIARLRIHSRLPVVLPERLDRAFRAWFAGTRLKPVLVLHANHPNELDASVAEALAPLRDDGITLLNQAVLLRGVNDDVETLVALSERLFGLGVMPYYLHQLDRVRGAVHFEVPEPESRELIRSLAAWLPGYLVPRLAREDAGAPSKTWLT